MSRSAPNKTSAMLLLFFGFIFHILGEDIKFQAIVSKNPVGVGEPFRITYKINKNARIIPPSFGENFNVISGPNQSSSFSFINGEISYEISISYVLVPKNKGQWTIPPAKAIIDGKEYYTESVTINVEEGVSQQSVQTPKTQQSPPPVSSSEVKGEIFVKVVASKEKVYPGEPLLITYYIYTKYDILNLQIEKIPGINNAWVEEIPISSNISLNPTIVGNKQFFYAPIRKLLIYPQRSGKVEIPPLQAKVVARVPIYREPRDIFDMFFGSVFYENTEVQVKSNGLKIIVEEFPEKPPSDFSGISGNLSLSWKISTDTPNVNEPVTLRITISGEGNIKTLFLPNMEFPSFLESYEPKITDNTKVKEDGISGSKTWEWVLIPRKEGSFTMKEISFSYFDLHQKKFKRLSIPPITINVKKGDAQPSFTQGLTPIQIPGQKVQLIASDIKDIKRKQEKYDPILYITLPISAMPLYFLPILASLSVIILAKRKRKDKDLIRQEKAFKELKENLRKSLKLVKNQTLENALTKAHNAVFKYFSDKFLVPPEDINKIWIKEKLKNLKLDDQTIQNFISTLENIEMAVYAPSLYLPEKTKAQSLIIEITTLMEKLESTVREREREKTHKLVK